MTRLQEALDLYKDRLDLLIAKTGLSVDRLRALVAGADPTMREVRVLATAMELTVFDLAPSSPSVDKADLLFRLAANGKPIPAGPPVVSEISRKMGYSVDLLSPQPIRRSAPWSSEFEDVVPDNADAFAYRFRQLFLNDDQWSPFLTLPQVLSDQLRVVVFVINTGDLDGASAYLEGVPFIFVASRFPPRMLFTCAHELGHLLATGENNNNFALIDRYSENGAKSKTKEERFAQSFASALLLPATGVDKILKKVRETDRNLSEQPLGDFEVMYLARIFGVSFPVAARRCEALGLLPRGAALSFDRNPKEEYSSEEMDANGLGLPPRAEIEFPHVSPQLLEPVIEKIRSGELSVGRAASMLGFSIAELLTANAQTIQ